MQFLVLGIIAILVGIYFVSKKLIFLSSGQVMQSTGPGSILIVVGVLLIAISGLRIVDAGYVGVEKLFGKVTPTPLKEGLHLINPLKVVVPLTIRTEAYTMSGTTDEGQVRGDDSIKVLTSDGLTVTLEVTVWFKIKPDEAPRIYRELGESYVAKIVRPTVRTALRNAAAKHTSSAIYSSEKRVIFVQDVEQEIEPSFKTYGIILENTLLRNVALPQMVATAIETKLKADQEQQEMDFVLQKETKEAERKRIEAKGIADANREIADSIGGPYGLLIQQWIKEVVSSEKTQIIYVSSESSGLPVLEAGRFLDNK
ncbi:prohibitin family protein [bacterium]|nr:prohibitin family protein [bacterium]